MRHFAGKCNKYISKYFSAFFANGQESMVKWLSKYSTDIPWKHSPEKRSFVFQMFVHEHFFLPLIYPPCCLPISFSPEESPWYLFMYFLSQTHSHTLSPSICSETQRTACIFPKLISYSQQVLTDIKDFKFCKVAEYAD